MKGQANSNLSEPEKRLVQYLEETSPNTAKWGRIFCCGTSRSFYCTECFRLLIPKEDWPAALQSGELDLPFDVDIVLDVQERRSSSSGLDLVALNQAARIQRNGSDSSDSEEPLEEYKHTQQHQQQQQQQQRQGHEVRLFDLDQSEDLPNYDQEEDEKYGDAATGSKTFVLFPSKHSRPINEVAKQIRRLIVLDCKWTRTASQTHPAIQHLPCVHLVTVPEESYFWRWHNCGKGMVSTLEAVYFVAHDVLEAHMDAAEAQEDCPTEEGKIVSLIDQQRNLLYLMWFFALKRSVIGRMCKVEERAAPFTLEGKLHQRKLRAKTGELANG